LASGPIRRVAVLMPVHRLIRHRRHDHQQHQGP
jgi:hypothetical protein